MANKLKGELAVRAAGKEYVFRPTFDSICSVEEELGKPIMGIVESHDDAQLSTKSLALFLAAFEKSGVAPETLGGDIILEGGMNLLRSTAYQVMMLCIVGGKDTTKKAKAPAEPGKSTGASMEKSP
jgi:hypothetical protein